MKKLSTILVSTLLFGCVKTYEINTLTLDGIKTKVWFKPQADGESLVLKVANTSNTTMYIDWSDASFTYQVVNESGGLSAKTVPLAVFSRQDGLKKPIKINTYSMINPKSSKSAVYTLIPKMDFASSFYISDAEAYIYAPDKLKAPKKFKVNIAVCSGELKNGVMPVECSEGSGSWKDLSIKGTVGLIPAQ